MGLQELLEKEGIVELDEDLRGLCRSEIKRHFGRSRCNRIILSKLIKSLIWQAYTRIQDGTEAPITGNLRTFWYRFLKPALAKVPKKYLGKSDFYNAMGQLFAEMVLELKLFPYEDFDLTDENWENRIQQMSWLCFDIACRGRRRRKRMPGWRRPEGSRGSVIVWSLNLCLSIDSVNS